jgi:uncharacterized protein (DUF169 family)
MKYSHLSQALKEGLNLSHTPIAISFLPDPPTGVPHFSGIVPSACAFWRSAEERMFYAKAEDHYPCPVGAMTMGFELPAERKKEAEKLFAEMLRLQYLTEKEFPEIPSVRKPHAVGVYGPLAEFSFSPDVLLMILFPGQAMILSEATGASAWTGPALTLLGRPTCGAIPRVLEGKVPVTSSACIGARIYADLREEELVMVVPGDQLDELSDKLQGALEANRSLSEYHTVQKRMRVGPS